MSLWLALVAPAYVWQNIIVLYHGSTKDGQQIGEGCADFLGICLKEEVSRLHIGEIIRYPMSLVKSRRLD